MDVDRDFSGNVMPSVPEHNLTLSVSYEKKLSEAVTCFLRPTFRAISGLFVDDLNSAKTDGYRLLDFVGGVDLTMGHFNLVVSGGCLNSSDEAYVSFVNINSANGEFYEAGAPRNYFGGINLGYQF